MKSLNSKQRKSDNTKIKKKTMILKELLAHFVCWNIEAKRKREHWTHKKQQISPIVMLIIKIKKNSEWRQQIKENLNT